MGLKNFLKQQGFIQDDPADKNEPGGNPGTPQKKAAEVTPVYFPLGSAETGDEAAQSDPSFVSPLQESARENKNDKLQPDPSFIKFFENELVKANLPGPDYFEFRQLLVKTQQKMAAKGGSAPEVVLQAVLMSFEAQDVSPAKLMDAARHYKEVIKQKNDDFLKGAATEKSNQLQKRQDVLQGHNDAIRKISFEGQHITDCLKQLGILGIWMIIFYIILIRVLKWE